MTSRTFPPVFHAVSRPKCHFRVSLRVLMMALICCLINSSIIFAIYWKAPSKPSIASSANLDAPVIAIFDNPTCYGDPEIHTVAPNLTNIAPSGHCTQYMDHWATWKCNSEKRERLDSHSLWITAYEGQTNCFGFPTRIDSWATRVCLPRGSKSVIYGCSLAELSNFDFPPDEDSPVVEVDLDTSADCDESGCPLGVPQRLMYTSGGCSGRPLHRSLPFGKAIVDECYYDVESGSNMAVYCNEKHLKVEHSFNGCNDTSSFVWKRETYSLGQCFPIAPHGYSFSYVCESIRDLKEEGPRPVQEEENAAVDYYVDEDV